MKRLYSISIVIALVSILSISCQTEKDYSSLSAAEGKKGIEAVEIYSTFLSQDEDERVRWNYVYSLYEAGEYETALVEIDKGISLYPDNIRFIYLKSLVLRSVERIEEEKATLEVAGDLNPGSIEIRKRLLDIYDSLGEIEKAKEEAKAILLYDNKNLTAIEYLSKDSEFYALLFESLNQKEEPQQSDESPEIGEEETTDDLEESYLPEEETTEADIPEPEVENTEAP